MVTLHALVPDTAWKLVPRVIVRVESASPRITPGRVQVPVKVVVRESAPRALTEAGV